MNQTKPEVLVFSPVRLPPHILTETLSQLDALQAETISLQFLFYDDNDNPLSSEQLRAFCRDRDGTARILDRMELQGEGYFRAENTHSWNSSVIDRIIAI